MKSTAVKSNRHVEYYGDQLVLDGEIPEHLEGSTVVKATAYGADGSQSKTRTVEADGTGRYTLTLDLSELPEEAKVLLIFWHQSGDIIEWLDVWRRPGIDGSCTVEDMSNNQTVPPCACNECFDTFATTIYNESNEARHSGINVYDGAVITALPIFDFETRALDFSLTLFHQSLKHCNGEVGQSWSHNFNLSIVQTSSTSGYIQTPNLEAFPFSAENWFSDFIRLWNAPEGFYSKLTRNDRLGRWRLTHHTGLEFEFAIGALSHPGPLIGIRDPNGNFMRVHRTYSGFVRSVVTDLQQEIIFGYDSEGRLSSITDHLGRLWALTYDGSGNLTNLSTPETEFVDIMAEQEVTDSNLSKLLVTKTRTTSLDYEDPEFPHQITRITDQRGAMLAEYTYYNDPTHGGRVKAKTINGHEVVFIYDPSMDDSAPLLQTIDPGNRVTRIIDRENNVTDYEMHGPTGGPINGLGKFGLRRLVQWTERGRGNQPLRLDEPLYWERRWLYECDCLAPLQASQPFRSDAPLFYDSFHMPINYPSENFEYNDRQQITAYRYVSASPDPINTAEVIQWKKTYDTFDRFSRLLTYTEPRAFDDQPIYTDLNFVHTYIYDDYGNLIEHIAPSVTRGVENEYDIRQSWTYNAFGQMTKHTDANGNATTYSYFEGPATGGHVNTKGKFGGYLASTTRGTVDSSDLAADLTTEYRVNALGLVTRTTDPEGFVYDHQFNDLLEKTRDLDATVTLRNGNTIRYETRYIYDGYGQLVFAQRSNFDVNGSVPSNDSIGRSQTFDAVGNLISVRIEVDEIDDNDLVTRYAYDRNDQFTIVQYPEGNRTFHVYDERGLHYKTFSGIAPPFFPPAVVKSLEQGYPTDKRAETLGSTSFVSLEIVTYDSRFNEIQKRDGRGNFTDSLYDFFNRRIAVIDPNGHGTVTAYDDASNVLTIENGEISRSSGDILEAPERTYFRYDEIGRHYQTVFDLDLDTFEDENLDPEDGTNASFRTTFDQGSRIRSQNDANGNSTNYQYDAADRTLSVVDALGNSRSYFYDKNSNIISVEEIELPSDVGPTPEIYTTTYTYDALGRLTETHDLGLRGSAIDHATFFAYDSRNNRVLVQDAEGNTIWTTFDDSSRPILLQRFNGLPLDPSTVELSRRETHYDRNGSRIVDVVRSDVNDPASEQSTRYAYDHLDRLIRIVHPDSDDPMTGSGNGLDGVYDRIEIDYDENSNVISTREQRGVEVVSDYDLGNRLIAQMINRPPEVPGTTLQRFEYDTLDRLKRAENNYALIERDYDALSRLTFERQAIRLNGSGFTNGWGNPIELTFSYDRQSNRESLLVFGSSGTTSRLELISRYTSDALNRVQTIEAGFFDRPFGPIAAYSYLGPTRVQSQVLGNGAALFKTYDDKRRVETHTWSSSSVGGQPLISLGYDYDDVDNPLFELYKHDLDLADSYSYNGRYELTGVDYRGQTPLDYRTGLTVFETSFSFDDNGNRREASFTDPFGNSPGTEDIYQINEANEYTDIDRSVGGNSANTSPPLYDTAGNVAQFPVRPAIGTENISDVNLEAIWDAFSLLSRAKIPDSDQLNGVFEEDYLYDPLHRRIARFDISDDGCPGCPRLTGRRFIYDGWSVVAERLFEEDSVSEIPVDINDRLERVYVGEIESRQPLVAAIDGDSDLDLDGGSLPKNSPNGTDFEYYYLDNRQGSVMGLLDFENPSRILEYYRYGPYGEPISLSIVDNGIAPGSVAGDGLEDTPFDLADNSQATTTEFSQNENFHFYNSQRYDGELGLYHDRVRSYEPVSGRFLSRNRTLNPQGSKNFANLYALPANNPTRVATSLSSYLLDNRIPAMEAPYFFSPQENRVAMTEAPVLDQILATSSHESLSRRTSTAFDAENDPRQCEDGTLFSTNNITSSHSERPDQEHSGAPACNALAVGRCPERITSDEPAPPSLVEVVIWCDAFPESCTPPEQTVPAPPQPESMGVHMPEVTPEVPDPLDGPPSPRPELILNLIKG